MQYLVHGIEKGCRRAGWLETISETLLDEAETGPWVEMSTNPTTVIWHLIEHDLHNGGEFSLTLGMHGLAAPDL